MSNFQSRQHVNHSCLGAALRSCGRRLTRAGIHEGALSRRTNRCLHQRLDGLFLCAQGTLCRQCFRIDWPTCKVVYRSVDLDSVQELRPIQVGTWVSGSGACELCAGPSARNCGCAGALGALLLSGSRRSQFSVILWIRQS
mmetsp:Transcript_6151/g.13272  ORF Transcript_6151/g.13272 Transcript_6151/m.13272 type:complete len:141 (+) Transcript_6151:621-1043(+)